MWYNSVEFYVIAGAIAAAAVVAAALPARRGEAKLHLVGGELSQQDDEFSQTPELDISVDENYRVTILRKGLTNVTDGGAASLAINVVGFDISVEERLTAGKGETKVGTATFRLDFLAPERYHVKYNSEDTGLFTAFTLNVAPGIKFTKQLK